MKQSLPWNVTGIPAEARELARAAAAREGISVGDWLTRRILGEAAAKPADTASAAPAPLRVERMGDARRDDTAPRPPAETDPNARRGEDPALKRIDETLRTLARRIEAAERT